MLTLTHRHTVPERPALVDRLEHLGKLGRPAVALITAPPGFGKFALVRRWITSSAKPIAHLRINRELAAAEFWTNFVDTVTPTLSAAGAEQLHAVQRPDRFPKPAYVRDLLDAVGSEPVTVVIEGLQWVSNPDVQADLDELVRQLPSAWTLVLVSRQWAALPSVLELSLHDRLERITMRDLAYSQAEVEALAAEAGVNANRVWKQTEGWPAMVNLVVSLGADARLDVHLQRDQGLVEYLFTEAFGQQDEISQNVLMRAAVSASSPVAMLAEITGRADVGARLHELTASGLVSETFAPDGSTAYQLHPILRNFLRAEFVRRDAGAFRAAHRVAAEFAARSGDGMAAIRHGIAGDPDSVGELLATVGAGQITGGRSEALLELLLPRVRSGGADAWTCTVTAAALADTGHFEECAAALTAATKTTTDRDPASADLRALQASVGSQVRRWRGVHRSVSIPETTEFDPDVALLARIAFGAELLRTGSLDDAEALLGLALEQAKGLGRGPARVEVQAILAGLASARGDFTRAKALATEGLHDAHELGVLATGRSLGLLSAAGWAAYYQLDTSTARRMAQHSLELLDHGHDPTAHALARGLTSLTTHGEAPFDSAWFHDVWRDSSHRLAPQWVARFAMLDASRSFHAGRADRIKDTVETLREHLGPTLECHVASAYLRVARGLNVQALAQLEPTLADADVVAVDSLTRIEAHALVSWLAAHRGDPYHAVEQMRIALELADNLGAPRTILAVGPVGLELLTQRRGSWGSHEALVEQVLDYVQTPSTHTTVALTARELDVLRELPTLRTVEQIADDMVVSINTLKTHLRSIYRKLGVSARRDAVTEARRSGLL